MRACATFLLLIIDVCVVRWFGAAQEIRDHVVHIWYLWSDAVVPRTIVQQKTVRQINNTVGAYEFDPFPELLSPSEMQFRIDVTLTNIRLDAIAQPTGNYLDSLLVWFESPFVDATLLAPLTVPNGLSFEVLPVGYLFQYMDPTFNFGGSLEPELRTGGFVMAFNTTEQLAETLEFSYILDIAPTSTPTARPTIAPTPTFAPTAAPTTSNPTFNQTTTQMIPTDEPTHLPTTRPTDQNSEDHSTILPTVDQNNLIDDTRNNTNDMNTLLGTTTTWLTVLLLFSQL